MQSPAYPGRPADLPTHPGQPYRCGRCRCIPNCTGAGRLQKIWADETISDEHRKALLRCLIEKVVLDRGEYDLALARIVWRGGAVTELEVRMSVNSVTRLTRGTEMRARLLALARDGVPDDEITAILTQEGQRYP